MNMMQGDADSGASVAELCLSFEEFRSNKENKDRFDEQHVGSACHSKCVPSEVRCMSEAHGSRGGHSSHASPALKMNSVSFSTCARERLIAGTSSLVKRTAKYSVIVY